MNKPSVFMECDGEVYRAIVVFGRWIYSGLWQTDHRSARREAQKALGVFKGHWKLGGR
jgi:hypothetical protein